MTLAECKYVSRFNGLPGSPEGVRPLIAHRLVFYLPGDAALSYVCNENGIECCAYAKTSTNWFGHFGQSDGVASLLGCPELWSSSDVAEFRCLNKHVRQKFDGFFLHFHTFVC